MKITGKTRFTGILGYPVSHSLSPAMHNAAFEAMKLDCRYLPLSVGPKDLAAALTGLRALGCRGLNVTIPHKRAVVSLLDGLSREARLIGAVNTIEFRGSRLIGHNTDGRGFARAFGVAFGKSVKGRRVLLLGAGGAARAVAVQVLLDGGASLALWNRSVPRAQALIRHLRSVFPGRDLTRVANRAKALESAVRETDIVINATSLGMRAGDATPLPRRYLRRGLWVYDLVYSPKETRLVREVRRAGGRAQNGLGMLLYQGALAFEIWTGRRPDVGKMKRALLRELTG